MQWDLASLCSAVKGNPFKNSIHPLSEARSFVISRILGVIWAPRCFFLTFFIALRCFPFCRASRGLFEISLFYTLIISRSSAEAADEVNMRNGSVANIRGKQSQEVRGNFKRSVKPVCVWQSPWDSSVDIVRNKSSNFHFFARLCRHTSTHARTDTLIKLQKLQADNQLFPN